MCKHTFHENCLRTWYETSRSDSCPICRRRFSSVEVDIEQYDPDFELHQAQAEYILNSLPDDISSSERLETEPDLLDDEEIEVDRPYVINS